eukprot:2423388-Rhodomonas_salina.1
MSGPANRPGTRAPQYQSSRFAEWGSSFRAPTPASRGRKYIREENAASRRGEDPLDVGKTPWITGLPHAAKRRSLRVCTPPRREAGVGA